MNQILKSCHCWLDFFLSSIMPKLWPVSISLSFFLPPHWTQSSKRLGSFAWFLDAVNRTSLETFWHTQVLNIKYLWLVKISVSLWCSLLIHECGFFAFYLFVHLFICLILFSVFWYINYLSSIFSHVIISLFYKEKSSFKIKF